MDEIQPDVAQPEGAFCIEIRFNPDGSIQVGVEELQPEEEGEGMGNYQTVPDIQAALKLVQDIYANGGQSADESTQAMEEGYQ